MKYKPLDFATFEFRLLDTIPCRRGEAEDSLVRCTLHHSSLIEPPAYRALSYCWGDPLITRPIIIDGEVVQVTANLEAALRQLRELNLSAFWIDAICINQADLVERGLQVMRMERIFSSATEVIAWLGEDADGACLAVQQLKDHKLHGKPAPWSSNLEPSVITPNIVNRSPNYPRRTPTRAKARDTPFGPLFNRPFWSRIWIIQEVAKAKNLQILVGNQMITWSDFEYLFEVLEGTPRHLLSLQEFRVQEQKGVSTPTLFAAMNRSRYFQSTDTRDKIYALLGLTSDGPQLIPTPNYIQTPDIVYFQGLKAIIARCQEMSYLVRQTEKLTQPQKDTVPPEWINLGSGVPGWMFSILRIAFHSPSFELRLTRTPRSPCFPLKTLEKKGPRDPTRDTFPLPCLYFTGLAVSVRITDSIRAIATQPDFLEPVCHLEYARTVESTVKAWRPSMSSRIQSVLLEKHPRATRPNLCTAVLSDFYHALKGAHDTSGDLISDRDRLDEIAAAYTFTYLCLHANWKTIADPASNTDRFSNWAHANQRIVFYGKTLRQWVQMYSTTEAYRTQCLASTGARQDSPLSRLVSNSDWDSDVRLVMSGERQPLQSMARASALGLRLAVGANSTILVQLWGGSGVRTGDLVCHIQGSEKPIILRKDERGYTFLCESGRYSDVVLSDPAARFAQPGAANWSRGSSFFEDGGGAASSADGIWETIIIR